MQKLKNYFFETFPKHVLPWGKTPPGNIEQRIRDDRLARFHENPPKSSKFMILVNVPSAALEPPRSWAY